MARSTDRAWYDHLDGLPLVAALLLLLCSIACDLSTTPTSAPPAVVIWDTTFSIAGLRFPHDSLVDRALVDIGDPRRTRDFLGKCNEEDTVRIGFIGGSITAGSSASTTEGRYSSVVCASLQHAYPNTHFVEVNAGIGATPSRFGCSRLRHDVLSHDPDLVVVEFSVNDYGEDDFMVEPYEGLVRQCLDADSSLAVLLLFMTNNTGYHYAQDLHQQVGFHYGVPMVSYRDAVWPLVEGGLCWDSIAADGIHPNDNGHLITAALVCIALERVGMEPGSTSGHVDWPVAPLYTDVYDDAGIHTEGTLPVEVLHSSWSTSTDGEGRIGYVSTRKGDSLVLRACAREVTLGYRRGVDLEARVRVCWQDTLSVTLDSHFAGDWGGGYTSFSPLFLRETASPLHVTLVNETGGAFEVQYVLYAGLQFDEEP